MYWQFCCHCCCCCCGSLGQTLKIGFDSPVGIYIYIYISFSSQRQKTNEQWNDVDLVCRSSANQYQNRFFTRLNYYMTKKIYYYGDWSFCCCYWRGLVLCASSHCKVSKSSRMCESITPTNTYLTAWNVPQLWMLEPNEYAGNGNIRIVVLTPIIAKYTIAGIDIENCICLLWPT